MLRNFECHALLPDKCEDGLSRAPLIRTRGARAAVLLLTLPWFAGVSAGFPQSRGSAIDIEPRRVEEAYETSLRVFEFTCAFYLPMGNGRLDGRIASDGSRSRIAIHWIEPAIFRESPFFPRYTDLLFTHEAVHYWIHDTSQPAILNFGELPMDSLLPRQRSTESIIRSALAIVSCIRDSPKETRGLLEVATFFNAARGHARHTHQNTVSEEVTHAIRSDVQVLNMLPYGRTYTKETRTDGAVTWREGKTLNGQPVASIVVRPIVDIERLCLSDVFDVGTLGKWTLIPEPYRAYWSFDRSYVSLKGSVDEVEASRDLYDKIDRNLKGGEKPPEIRRALNRLRFKTALLAQDKEWVQYSAQASVAGLCQGDSTDSHDGLLELARISGQIERLYPQQAREWLQPLVRHTVAHFSPDVAGNLDRLLPAVTANRWFTYGGLLVEEILRQGLMEENAIAILAAGFEATRMATSQGLFDPCEAHTTVSQYLLQMDANPPKGEIDMNALRQILERGLAKCYANGGSEGESNVVHNVMRSIRLIIGEGPFRAQPDQLATSIERFSRLYLEVARMTEPIDTVLATFLALSFCDISTTEDHEVLLSQFREQYAEAQSAVNAMLRDRGLDSLLTSEDVKGVFDPYERILRRHIDDPLWPPFKFPLTSNEQTRLAGKQKLRLMQLAPFLDDMSLKVKYGGTNPELKKRTVFEISRAAQQLLPDAAFLRKPPYPGVLCEYRGGYGFMVAIKGPLYQEGNRPKERFQAMKYFHLGHRLQGVVERERELLAPPGIPNDH